MRSFDSHCGEDWQEVCLFLDCAPTFGARAAMYESTISVLCFELDWFHCAPLNSRRRFKLQHTSTCTFGVAHKIIMRVRERRTTTIL